MSEVFHSRGASTLAEACVQTVLNPSYALGLVSVTGIEGESVEKIEEILGLEEVSKSLGKAWVDNKYPGVLSNFSFLQTRDGAPKPHIDQRKGYYYNSPERVAILSIARYGIGHVRGQQFPAVILPGEEAVDHALLAEMRQVSYGLDLDRMPIDFEHHPSQVLIIPTLPSPTAHAVEPLTKTRETNTWECTLDLS